MNNSKIHVPTAQRTGSGRRSNYMDGQQQNNGVYKLNQTLDDYT